jgi:hypothetical protein
MIIGLMEPRRLFGILIGSLSIAIGILYLVHRDTLSRPGTWITGGWGFGTMHRLMPFGAGVFILYGIFAIAWAIAGPV